MYLIPRKFGRMYLIPRKVMHVTKNYPKKELLLPDRHPQKELFLCDVADAVLKDIVPHMEHPLYNI